jgi:hypothetical protein
VWVDLVAALIVEGYREFLEWWQNRSFLRPSRGAPGDESEDRPVGERFARAVKAERNWSKTA